MSSGGEGEGEGEEEIIGRVGEEGKTARSMQKIQSKHAVNRLALPNH